MTRLVVEVLVVPLSGGLKEVTVGAVKSMGVPLSVAPDDQVVPLLSHILKL